MQKHKYFPLFIYVLLVLGVMLFLGFYTYLRTPPGGMHFWRQSDSASFIAYYYEHGLNFFEPGTYNMNCADGKAASEFPILYYITAVLWHIFGRQEYTLKVIDTLIVLTGFYCFFKIAVRQIGNQYAALALTLLLMSSSTLLTYTANYLPDPPSLGLCLIGAYYFFRFAETGNYKLFLLAFAVFTLSSLIKISLMVFPLSIVGLVFIERIVKLKLGPKPLFTGSLFKYVWPMATFIGIVALWVVWVKSYNAANTCNLFLTNPVPIWKFSQAEVVAELKRINHDWLSHYYYKSTVHVLLVIIVLGLLNIKYWGKLNLWLCSFLLLGGLSYFLLFFKLFEAHDYYIIALFIPLVFTVLFSFASFYNRFKVLKTSWLPVLGLAVIAALSLNYAKKKIAQRSEMIEYIGFNMAMYDIRGKVEEYGIPKDATVFSFPDSTPNGTLYYLRRKGFTNWQNYGLPGIPALLNEYIHRGAQYLVINHPDYYQFAQSDWFDAQQVGEYKGIRMYKVTPKTTHAN